MDSPAYKASPPALPAVEEKTSNNTAAKNAVAVFEFVLVFIAVRLYNVARKIGSAVQHYIAAAAFNDYCMYDMYIHVVMTH